MNRINESHPKTTQNDPLIAIYMARQDRSKRAQEFIVDKTNNKEHRQKHGIQQ